MLVALTIVGCGCERAWTQMNRYASMGPAPHDNEGSSAAANRTDGPNRRNSSYFSSAVNVPRGKKRSAADAGAHSGTTRWASESSGRVVPQADPTIAHVN